jgi:putative membrane protein
MSSGEKAEFMSRAKRVNASKYAISIFRFGDFGFGAILPERDPFDDVSLPEGKRIIEAVKESGASDFAVIDAQSNYTPGVLELMDCSPLIRPFQREFQRMEAKYPIMAGYARGSYNIKSLGEMGIQVLTFNIDSTISAVILTDSNNITSDLMIKIRENLKDICKVVEIYTTDNHVVNGSTLDMNPLGEKDDNVKLVEKIRNITELSIASISECTAEMGSADVNVKMGSEESYQELLDTVFSSVKVSKRLAGIIIPAAFLIPLIVTYLIYLVFL